MYWTTLLIAAHLTWLLVERPLQKTIRKAGTKMLQGQQRTSAKPAPAKRFQTVAAAIIAAEICLFVGLWYLGKPALDKITPLQAVSGAPGVASNVQFGTSVRLVSADVKREENRVKVRLVWQALQSGTLGLRQTTELVGGDRQPLTQVSFCEDPRNEFLPSGTYWQDHFDLDSPNDDAPKFVRIKLSHSHKALLPNTGANELLIAVNSLVR